ncbi:hypothetical protein HPB50_001594 [Hyalomma asiaticum]|uniref:Uncharacterized protein n=1 Tax=Hyalomma asiaticum TaxID=266040 RepID=A0ACB7T996_HYAAI|nr:hypothetical protein HPB50_001594 [Hyalomma asiaticum]
MSAGHLVEEGRDSNRRSASCRSNLVTLCPLELHAAFALRLPPLLLVSSASHRAELPIFSFLSFGWNTGLLVTQVEFCDNLPACGFDVFPGKQPLTAQPLCLAVLALPVRPAAGSHYQYAYTPLHPRLEHQCADATLSTVPLAEQINLGAAKSLVSGHGSLYGMTGLRIFPLFVQWLAGATSEEWEILAAQLRRALSIDAGHSVSSAIFIRELVMCLIGCKSYVAVGNWSYLFTCFANTVMECLKATKELPEEDLHEILLALLFALSSLPSQCLKQELLLLVDVAQWTKTSVLGVELAELFREALATQCYQSDLASGLVKASVHKLLMCQPNQL